MEMTLPEMKAVFIRLKKEESSLSATERGLLLRIERMLYAKLSVQEAENLIQAVSKNLC